MPELQGVTAKGIAEEARRVLTVVQQAREAGQLPTLGSIRGAVQGGISIRLSEYISFLDKYQYLSLRRSDGTLGVTDGGAGVLDGRLLQELLSHVSQHFAAIVRAQSDEPIAVPAVVAESQQPVAADEPITTVSETKERSVSDEARFVRGEAIGTGGLAIVYRATQSSVNRDVAYKEFRDVFQYFTAEQRGLIIERLKSAVVEHASLSHANIARILDFIGSSEAPALIMEHYSGGSLRDRLKGSDRLAVANAVRFFLQIAEALAYAHRRGVLHRNLKPENVLLDTQGNAQVVDFGVTRMVERDNDSIHQVIIGVGTVAYMAPEQYQDARNASVQGDIYSLGIILYELLTGKVPGRRSPMPSAYFEDVPADLDDIFDKMTMDFLEVRYATMDDVLADIYGSDEIMAVLGGGAPQLFTGRENGVSAPIAASAPEVSDPPAEPAAVEEPSGSDEELETADEEPDHEDPAVFEEDDVTLPDESSEDVLEVADEPDLGGTDSDAGGVGAMLDSMAGDLFDD